ncbi:hypothetical protein [Prevotella sp. Rep29]|uniref:hypothetical protein n=1 Tax=Prevotella sp. Rep29 TaxID=2691580 RepID=UPI001C6E20A0|nr:hypothetical protein [Prevotella sp. Rep29]MBQ3624877.1 hypothetical protein [Prevotella sp.]QYR10382.1 hypothetical protein GRF55_04395 [Prevotella sp. Rep29]
MNETKICYLIMGIGFILLTGIVIGGAIGDLIGKCNESVCIGVGISFLIDGVILVRIFFLKDKHDRQKDMW